MYKVFLILLLIFACTKTTEEVEDSETQPQSISAPSPKYKVLKYYNEEAEVVTNIVTNPAAHYLIVMTIKDYYTYNSLKRTSDLYSDLFYSNETKESLRKSMLADSNEINFYKQSILKVIIPASLASNSNWQPGCFIYEEDLQ